MEPNTRIDDDEGPFDEEYEAVPWDALVRPPAPDTRRLVNMVALALGAAAIAALTVRTIWPSAPIETSVPQSVTAAAHISSETATPPTDASAPPAAPTEADLMALDPAATDRAAAAVAEWFAIEYFTVDGDAAEADPWLGVAPKGDPGSLSVSYVESATAVAVERVSIDRHLVTVVVRTLSSQDPADGYRRDPVRAVSISVVSTEGVPVVEDYPTPAPTPPMWAVPPTVATIAVDPVVVEAAKGMASVFGVPGEPYSVVAANDGSVRVALLVEDGSGVVRPMAFWFDPDGEAIR